MNKQIFNQIYANTELNYSVKVNLKFVNGIKDLRYKYIPIKK